MIARRPTFRVVGYALVVLAGLTAALLTGRPEPAVLATPFAAFLVFALTAPPPPIPAVRLGIASDRLVEGDETMLTISSDTAEVELEARLPDGVRVVDAVERERGVDLTLAFDWWGVFDVGEVAARTFDAHRVWSASAVLHSPLKVRVHPRVDRLPPHLVAALELQPYVGHHPSRAAGDGFDFADLRPYRPGDRARSVNWRASARHGGLGGALGVGGRSLWVNDRHPDRSSSVIVLLDTFGTDRASRVASLQTAVQAVAGIAEVYGRVHDHVGLLTFGGHLRWLRPAGGRRHVLRIVDALLDAEQLLTDVWGQVDGAGVGAPARDRVPVGVIPPGSLLLAVTPLQSDTAMLTLIDLRARGFDVAVVAVSGPVGVSRQDDRPAASLGRRLDDLTTDARRLSLERSGIAVTTAGESISAALRELDEWRRRTPRVRV